MEELLFDDDIFGESNSRAKRIEDCYKPKECRREWFVQFCPRDEPSEVQNVKKYQADLFYHRRQYKDAMTCYLQLASHSPVLSKNCAVLDRELKESVAMCLWKLGEFSEAVATIKELMAENQQNTDSSMWHLLAQVYRDMGDIQGEIEALQTCATFHPWNYNFWFSLALVYEQSSLVGLNPEQKNYRPLRHCCSHTDVVENNRTEDTLNNREHVVCDCPRLRHVRCNRVVRCNEYNSIPSCGDDSEKAMLCCEDEYNVRSLHSSQSVHTMDTMHKDKSKAESKTYCVCTCIRCTDCARVQNGQFTMEHLKYLHEQGIPIVNWRWKNHVLSFCCLVKSRFFVQKAIEASASFVQMKHKAFLEQVNEKINSHTDCRCALQTDEVFQMLHSSVLASGGHLTDQESTETNRENSRRERQGVDLNRVNFEQKWFSDVLSHMI